MGLESYIEARGFQDLGTTEGGITEGVSIKGMEAYMEYLKLNVLEKILEKLDDTKEIGEKINAGWQGTSRDKFLSNFQKMIDKVKEDLANEFFDLSKKMSELAQDYFIQDRDMLKLLD